MDSLNPGKAMAQAAHAANQFGWSQSAEEDKNYPTWIHQSGLGWGTTIVLDIGNEETLISIVRKAGKAGMPAASIIDPSYPISDGDVVHHIPLVTCGYVFGMKDEVSPFLGEYPLYR